MRVRLADSEDLSFSNAEILQYVNDGCKDLAMAGVFQEKRYVSFLHGECPLDCYWPTEKFVINVFRVDWVDEYNRQTVQLHFAPLAEHPALNSAWSTGTPRMWTLWGDTLYIDVSGPIALNIWYTYSPGDLLSISDTIPLSPKWTPGLLAYCEYRCRAAEGDPDAAAALAEYNAVKTTAQQVNAAILTGAA
ncbi:MAG: hypothetical protein LLF76_02740 [Planctomycetaceae bacterium]|nr:hypothetical protein [Planctomycetaceae bacterium]